VKGKPSRHVNTVPQPEGPVQIIEQSPADRQIRHHHEVDVMRDQHAVDQHVDIDIRPEWEIVRIEGDHLGKHANFQIDRPNRAGQQDLSHRRQQKSNLQFGVEEGSQARTGYLCAGIAASGRDVHGSGEPDEAGSNSGQNRANVGRPHSPDVFRTGFADPRIATRTAEASRLVHPWRSDDQRPVIPRGLWRQINDARAASRQGPNYRQFTPPRRLGIDENLLITL
jgi:hypothetical protein